MDDKRIAVLGAGPMGLAVAYQLAKDGYSPVVFEADDRLGGMTACFDFGGMRIERFYHFHCISDRDFLELIEELGIADQMRWTETRMGYYFEGRLHRWGNPFALLRFPGLDLISKLRYALHVFLATKRTNWSSLDKITAIEWIKSAVGERAYDVLWRKLFDYKFYDYAQNLSAAWIWSRIRRVGRSRYDLFREKLGHLQGGSDTFLGALGDGIARLGGEIRLSSPVEQVVIDETKTVRGVMVSGRLEPFTKVISTLPLPFVPRLMPGLPSEVLQAYEAIQNIAVVCVIARLRRPVTDNFWLNVNDPRMDIPGLVEYTNLYPMDQHVVYVPFYMPGEHPKFKEPNEVFLEKVRNYLRMINPQLSDDDFLELRASRYRYAQPVCGPGFLSGLPPVALPVKGLWVADTSYYYPEDRGISESVGFGRKMARQAIS